jgi:hypothetical protein
LDEKQSKVLKEVEEGIISIWQTEKSSWWKPADDEASSE